MSPEVKEWITLAVVLLVGLSISIIVVCVTEKKRGGRPK